MKISHLILGLILLVSLFYIGQAVSVLPFKVILVLIIGLIFSFLTLMNLEIGLYLLIFVVPFTQQLTLGKFAYAPVDIGTDDVLIIFIILSWLANLAKSKEPIFLKTFLNWPIMAFLTVAIFSFIGAHRIFGMKVVLIGFLHLFKFFEYVVIYFIVTSTVKNVRQIRKFIFMFFIVVGFIVILHFIAVARMGTLNLSVAASTRGIQIYMIETMYAFQSNAILGAYYIFFISILLAIILNRAVLDKPKMGLILFAFVLSIAIFNTYSRAAYLGLAISFFTLAILKEKRLFLLILLLLLFSPIYLQKTVLERIALTVQTVRPSIVLDPSAAIRLVIWKKGIETFLNNFIIGTGYWTTRWVIHGEAHSQYLATLIETGVVGLCIFLWLIIRMFKNAIILMRRANTEFLNALGVGYVAGLAAIFTTCFFSETLEAFRMIGPLWFVTGLITSANRLLSEDAGIDST